MTRPSRSRQPTTPMQQEARDLRIGPRPSDPQIRPEAGNGDRESLDAKRPRGLLTGQRPPGHKPPRKPRGQLPKAIYVGRLPRWKPATVRACAGKR